MRLDNQYAALTTDFGQTDLTLTINVNASAVPGGHTVTVNGTNDAFTANPTPGVALATQQSVAIRTSRDPSITIDLYLTTEGRYVGNVYDPDGTRVELDDE